MPRAAASGATPGTNLAVMDEGGHFPTAEHPKGSQPHPAEAPRQPVAATVAKGPTDGKPGERHDYPLHHLCGDHRQSADEGKQPRRAGIDLRTGRKRTDRKSTRLNSSHVKISYAVFCLKKKKHT